MTKVYFFRKILLITLVLVLISAINVYPFSERCSDTLRPYLLSQQKTSNAEYLFGKLFWKTFFEINKMVRYVKNSELVKSPQYIAPQDLDIFLDGLFSKENGEEEIKELKKKIRQKKIENIKVFFRRMFRSSKDSSL
ncbi:MAG: hypothetical protein KKD11_06915 [Candidatus Omnitrophica bacterium]|nr:hypothetical protein [Candidatus Omnitrophota bacterium]